MNQLKNLSKIWWVLIGLGIIYASVGSINCNEKWINSFLQIGAIVLSLMFTLILNIENNAKMTANTQLQLDKIAENTDRQIEEIRIATEKEINALLTATEKQIENYKEETGKLVREMRTSSELLAGILQRQLEEAYTETNQQLIKAKNDYQNLSSFKLLRTQKEKEVQLQRQKTYIESVTNRLNFFKTQIGRVVNFFRGGN